MKHPTAPPRQCNRTTIEDYYRCYSCESSIAKEEQCVHSIVANENKFLPDQFATYHFRRKYVSGSYVSFDPTERDDNNDISDDDSINDTNISLMADNGYTNETQEAAHYEQLPSTKSNIKCLSDSDLKKVMDNILSGYSTCGDGVKKKVNGILLSLNEICSTDGYSNGIFDPNMSSDALMDDAINDIINEHQLSFLPATNNFLSQNTNTTNYLRPSMNQMRRQKRARIMSNRHRIIKKLKRSNKIIDQREEMVHINTSKVPACRFCGSIEQGERLSSCKKRSYLKSMSVEYILGSGHDGLTNFIQKMEHTTMFETSTSKPTNIIEVGENSKSKHFFIHRVWTNNLPQNPKTDIEDIIFEFSYITKSGDIDKVKTQIHGKALHAMLVSCNLKKGPIFVYDKTPYKGNIQNLNYEQGTNNINWLQSQNEL